MLGIMLSIVFQVVMMFLVFMFKGKFSTLDRVSSNSVVSWSYVVYLVLYGGVSLSRLTTIDNVLPSSINGILCVVLFGVTCIYCAKLGFKTLFRGSIVVTFLVIVSFLVVVYGVTQNMDISNAYLYNDRHNVFYYTLSDLANSIDLVFLVLLMESSYTRRDCFKYLAIKLLSLEVITFIGLCVLGGITVFSEYPFIDLASYSQPFGIQRSDGIYSFITTLMCVLNVSLGVMLANRLSKGVFKTHGEVVLVLLMVVVSYLVPTLDTTLVSAILVLLLGCIVPSILNLPTEIH
jgi:hypothetical protein